MAKETKSANTIIGTQDDFLGFVGSLLTSGSKKNRAVVKATVGDISSLDISKLRDAEEAIYLLGTNIEINLRGDVGIFSAALLSRRFKRKGFAGRNINLAIPASVNQSDKDAIIDRLGLCVKSEFSDKVKSLVKQGASISMAEAKNFGLIDQEVDLTKRRGSKPATAVVASEDKTVPENQTATT